MARTKVATILTQTRNLLINADMQIFQRGSSLATSGGAIYLVDRWSAWTSAAASVSGGTQAQSSLPAGFPGVASQSEGRAHRLHGTINDFTQNSSFLRRQRIESIRLRDGGRIINNISGGTWVYGNNMQTASIQVLQATGGSSRDDWSSSDLLLTETININDNEWTFVSFEDLTLPTGNGVEIRISLGSPAANVFTDTYITEAMCNEGPVVERFRLMGRDAEEEFDHCLRYFAKTYRQGIAPGTPSGDGILTNLTNSNGWSNVMWSFPKIMRGIPTFVAYNPNTGAANQWGNGAAVTFYRSSTKKVNIYGSAQGADNNVDSSIHATADAEL